MLNQLVVIGRIAKDPKLNIDESGRKTSTITLAVPRSYKNAQGEYETDFIDCNLFGDVAESTCDYCKTGDLIGVKGRVQSRIIEDGDKSYKKIDVVTERVTFLSSAKAKTIDDEIE